MCVCVRVCACLCPVGPAERFLSFPAQVFSLQCERINHPLDLMQCVCIDHPLDLTRGWTTCIGCNYLPQPLPALTHAWCAACTVCRMHGVLHVDALPASLCRRRTCTYTSAGSSSLDKSPVWCMCVFSCVPQHIRPNYGRHLITARRAQGSEAKLVP